MVPRRECKLKQGCLLRLQLPVSLFENEALLFNPRPPALSTHSLPCVDHSGRKTYKERGGGGKCISNRSLQVFEHLYDLTFVG